MITDLPPSMALDFDAMFSMGEHFDFRGELIEQERAASIVCAIYFDYGRALAWWVREPTKPLRFDLAWPSGFEKVGAS